MYAYGNPTVWVDLDGYSSILTEAEQSKVNTTANDDSWLFPVFEDVTDETADFIRKTGGKTLRSTGTRKTISRKTAQSLQSKTKGKGKDLLILEEGDDLETVASNIDKVLGKRALSNRSNTGMSKLARMLENHGAGDIIDVSTFARVGQIASQNANAEPMLRGAAKDASQNGKKAAAFILNAVAGVKETFNWATDKDAPDQMQRNARQAIISEAALSVTPFGIVRKGKTAGRVASGARTISSSSPAEIAWGFGELSKRQLSFLEKLPNELSSITLHKKQIKVTDLAALTAKTGDEFALFTNGSRRLLYRGTARGVNLTESTLKTLKSKGYKWSAHTHPGTSDKYLDASGIPGDRLVLDIFKQDRSLILNSSGNRSVFNMLDNIRVK